MTVPPMHLENFIEIAEKFLKNLLKRKKGLIHKEQDPSHLNLAIF